MVPASLYGLLLVLPFLGGLGSLLLRKHAGVFASAVMGMGLLGAFLAYFSGIRWENSWSWLNDFRLEFEVDELSALLILLVFFISALVHLFSIYYMEKDKSTGRYFFLLGFFTASMLGLLAADSLILVFIFWELVGFSSYLLIGFWFQDSENARSARVAFMVNRVADAFLLIGVILLISTQQITKLSELDVAPQLPFLVSIFIVIGAFGKSAQLPFSGWLLRAMAGPTPVSALIHAATMVTAGIYLLIRFSPVMGAEVFDVILIVGALTAFVAAFAALNQSDIKSVLAYSTVSQLGFMMMGIGAGAADFSLFHLWTHAFFKAGLFLASGSVIHFMEWNNVSNAQNMDAMGGLRKYLPVTFITFLLAGASLAGIPLFSGFLSKEGILMALYSKLIVGGAIETVSAWLGFLAAGMTAFYIARLVFKVFFGDARSSLQAHSEPKINVKLPLLLLALGSIWLLHTLNPFDSHGWWLAPAGLASAKVFSSIVPLIVALILSLLGIGLAYFFYSKDKKITSGFSYRLSREGWYLSNAYEGLAVAFHRVGLAVDRFDRKVVDTGVNGLGVLFIVFAKILGWGDRYIVDGAVNGMAALSRFFGRLMARIQAPLVQFQVLFAILIVISVLIWTLYF